MLPVILALLALLSCSTLLCWWLLRLHRALVLLAWAAHRAEREGDPEELAEAHRALAERTARFPAGALARWMGIELR